jgi:aminoglycoside N3'-acetyltransferase
MNTRQSLYEDIIKLGIKESDIVFLRVSYKSLGETEGGPQTFIDALLDVVGEKGTILATCFPKQCKTVFKAFYKNRVYYKGLESRTGIIPWLMIQNPSAEISTHPTYPYVAIGRHAKEIIAHYTAESRPYDIVRYVTQKYTPKCLRIGGNLLTGTTHVALTDSLIKLNQYQRVYSEGIYYIDSKGEKKWKESEASMFCYAGFKNFFNRYLYDCVLSEGMIGLGKSMITEMKISHDLEQKCIDNNPQILSCDNPNCVICRTSFSYSDASFIRFFLRQILLLLTKPNKGILRRIKLLFENTLLGNKRQ